MYQSVVPLLLALNAHAQEAGNLNSGVLASSNVNFPVVTTHHFLLLLVPNGKYTRSPPLLETDSEERNLKY